MDKTNTQNVRDLPAKRSFKEIYGVDLPETVEQEIHIQRASLDGAGPLEFYSDGSLNEYQTTEA
ncbi:hypothetical protein BGZ83_004476, partial [Gryganskiella cystojenkinii]